VKIQRYVMSGNIDSEGNVDCCSIFSVPKRRVHNNEVIMDVVRHTRYWSSGKGETSDDARSDGGFGWCVAINIPVIEINETTESQMEIEALNAVEAFLRSGTLNQEKHNQM